VAGPDRATDRMEALFHDVPSIWHGIRTVGHARKPRRDIPDEVKKMIRFFRHYIPTKILILVSLELLIILGSIYVGVSTRFENPALLHSGGMDPLLPRAVIFAIVMLVIMAALGLYDWDSHDDVRGTVLRVGASFLIGMFIMGQVFYLAPDLYLGRGVFGVAVLFAASGVLAMRLLLLKTAHIEALKRRVLVLGTGSRAARVESLLKRGNAGSTLHVVGYVPMGGVHHYVDHSRILGEASALTELVRKFNVDEIVLAVRERRGGAMPIAELLECKFQGVRVMELSTFFERENGQLQLESINASWMILSEGFHQGLMRDTVKRVFDVVVSTLMLVAALPIMAVTALAIRLESSGGALYRQERVGLGGVPFTILKFRSMRSDAEKDGKPQWASKDDDRITRVGSFIRKTRIDELPQLFNVFKGDMSFVGPRPERPYFVDDLARQIPYYNVRHTVKPGITGWAQVRYSYGASVEDALEKLQFDLYYVKNHSLFLDLMIIFQTAQVVIWGKGAR
jgi:sugar transferase (PEP-CTERM system associated)